MLTCISNEVGGPLIGNSGWAGPRLAAVLSAARPRPGAVDIVLRCADGYTVSLPVDRGAIRTRSSLSRRTAAP